jgi:outer membrane immunogenic protein
MISTLNKGWIASLVLFALAAGAHADDGRIRAKKAYAAAPVPQQWTGFYVGGNLGFGVAGITDNLPIAVNSAMYGAIGGVQVGYNYQINRLVLGVEADIQASSQSQSYTTTLPIVGDVTVGHKIPYFWTARGRVGYAFYCGCVMAYATLGIAYGSYQPYATALGTTVSTTYTNTALAAGAGVEWAVAEKWTAKLEALYLDTGNVGTNITLPIIGTVNARLRDLITRVGVNFHF